MQFKSWTRRKTWHTLRSDAKLQVGQGIWTVVKKPLVGKVIQIIIGIHRNFERAKSAWRNPSDDLLEGLGLEICERKRIELELVGHTVIHGSIGSSHWHRVNLLMLYNANKGKSERRPMVTSSIEGKWVRSKKAWRKCSGMLCHCLPPHNLTFFNNVIIDKMDDKSWEYSTTFISMLRTYAAMCGRRWMIFVNSEDSNPNASRVSKSSRTTWANWCLSASWERRGWLLWHAFRETGSDCRKLRMWSTSSNESCIWDNQWLLFIV